MRGRVTVAVRAERVEAALARRPVSRPSRWDLGTLSDEDLEALLPLAERQAAAEAAGQGVAWSPEESALPGRLWAEQAGEPR